MSVLKRILVPTDFSPTAAMALQAAVVLAKKAGAEVFLVHVLKKSDEIEEEGKIAENLTLYQEAMAEEASWQLNVLSGNFREVVMHLEVIFESLPQGILGYAKKLEVDLIVMGSHGTSGKEAFFLGTLARKVVRLASCPVLVLKEPMVENMDKVVFASDFSEEAMPSFQLLKDFVRYFNPEIHLVYIQADPFFRLPYPEVQNRMEAFGRLARPFTFHLHYLRDLSIDAGVRQVVKKTGAHLIALSNRGKHPLKRMISGSTVEALVNHANVPVLSINFKDPE